MKTLIPAQKGNRMKYLTKHYENESCLSFGDTWRQATETKNFAKFNLGIPGIQPEISREVFLKFPREFFSSEYY